MKLAGTGSPEEADALRGCKLLIRPTDRPPLADEDAFYAQVLVIIGCCDWIGIPVVLHDAMMAR